MDEPANTTEAKNRVPIFDFDIACPQCEYNLRGLVERLCPECGNVFDPHAVLMAHRDNQPPLPIGWVLRTIYRHPLTFWRLEQVRRSRGPTRLQIFFVLILVPFLVDFLCVMLGSIALSRSKLVLPRTAILVESTIFPAVLASLAAYAICLIHAILCRVGLLLSRQREGVRAAKEIVGYGLVWLAPLLLATTVFVPLAGSLVASRSSPWAQTTAVTALLAGAATCVAWAITTYDGGKFASGGSRLVGLWCVIANPFWYILGLVMWMVVQR